LDCKQSIGDRLAEMIDLPKRDGAATCFGLIEDLGLGSPRTPRDQMRTEQYEYDTAGRDRCNDAKQGAARLRSRRCSMVTRLSHGDCAGRRFARIVSVSE
jgi:hypothetical protein